MSLKLYLLDRIDNNNNDIHKSAQYHKFARQLFDFNQLSVTDDMYIFVHEQNKWGSIERSSVVSRGILWGFNNLPLET